MNAELKVRCSHTEKLLWEQAALASGSTLSWWVRATLKAEAESVVDPALAERDLAQESPPSPDAAAAMVSQGIRELSAAAPSRASVPRSASADRCCACGHRLFPASKWKCGKCGVIQATGEKA